VLAPTPIADPVINYIVLSLAFLFEGGSWLVSWRQFRADKGDLSYWQAMRRSKDPPSFMVLFEDSAALIGIVVAFLGIGAAELLDAPILDGVASVVIGLLLGGVAAILTRETKDLLIGERADPEIVASIRALAEQVPGVCNANGVFTVQLAPEQIVAALSLEFDDALTAPEIEKRVVSLEERVRQVHPEVIAIFIKPQTKARFHERERVGFGG
jgi:divalent metal cation (Fe/Co/Zn/Cd) transporter